VQQPAAAAQQLFAAPQQPLPAPQVASQQLLQPLLQQPRFWNRPLSRPQCRLPQHDEPHGLQQLLLPQQLLAAPQAASQQPLAAPQPALQQPLPAPQAGSQQLLQPLLQQPRLWWLKSRESRQGFLQHDEPHGLQQLLLPQQLLAAPQAASQQPAAAPHPAAPQPAAAPQAASQQPLPAPQQPLPAPQVASQQLLQPLLQQPRSNRPRRPENRLQRLPQHDEPHGLQQPFPAPQQLLAAPQAASQQPLAAPHPAEPQLAAPQPALQQPLPAAQVASQQALPASQQVGSQQLPQPPDPTMRLSKPAAKVGLHSPALTMSAPRILVNFIEQRLLGWNWGRAPQKVPRVRERPECCRYVERHDRWIAAFYDLRRSIRRRLVFAAWVVNPQFTGMNIRPSNLSVVRSLLVGC
jgi:hypothetical protein